ncbi:hypothetical protein ACFLSV_00100 [Bacteroidota bacterium]
MKAPYLPKDDPGKAKWLKHFASKTPTYAAVLGITPAEQTSIENDSAMYEYIVITVHPAYKSKVQDITAFKNMLRDGPLGTPTPPVPAALTLPATPTAVEQGIFKRVTKFVQRLKNHPNYTENMGEDLGIIGREMSFDKSELKPKLKGALDANRPKIIWKKGSFVDSIDLYVDRQLNNNYEYLTNDSKKDYIDDYPMPSDVASIVYRYKGIYRIGDEQVGQFSDPITITVTKQT